MREELQPTTEAGRRAVAAIVADPRQTLMGFDFDGVLAPIVADPEQAYVHPGAVDALRRISGLVGQVAIITGRPVRTVLRLGGFADDAGFARLLVAGQYGNERWDAQVGTIDHDPEPAGIAAAEDDIAALLTELALPAYVEHKGRALGVHTRQLPEPDAAFERLRDPLTEIASRHGLQLEPGKRVLELRGPGKHKGDAVRALVQRTGARQVVFSGDDLGDLPAFDAVDALRADGLDGLLVCSASTEQGALAARADLVVDGPDGVAAWLTALADLLEGRS